MNTPEVIYKIVPEFPAYRVGSDGSLWSRWTVGKREKTHMSGRWRRLNPYVRKSGYAVGSLKDEHSRPVYVFVHRLVLSAFVGPCPLGMDCCHGDGNRSNNALSNLRWDTRLANVADSRKHGTLLMGEKRKTSKLKTEDVRAIRARHAAGGVTRRQLAQEYGISQSNVGAVITRKLWAHVD